MSRNAPLRIAEIARPGNGLIGVTFAPGKKQPHALSGSHDRDLGTDLDAIGAWNAATVVTLVEDIELHELQIPHLGDEVRSRFMEWRHWPIRDGATPGPAFEQSWDANSARLRSLLACGANVLIHCKGGLGRAGMIAARLLVEMGMGPSEAIAAVRAARPGAVETRAQEEWVSRGRSQPSPAPPDRQGPRDRAVGALVGLAAGDAVGTTLEFGPKPHRAVFDDMVGGGPFRLKGGQWTDDTAMALALADTLLEHPDIDATALMERFVAWHEHGRYSCTGTCFDIGIATSEALERFRRSGDPLAGSPDPSKAGNGALMRLAPVAIRHWSDRTRLLKAARTQTLTTHGAKDCIEASEIFAEILAEVIAGRPLPEVLEGPAAARIAGDWRGAHRDVIRGSGYVVHSLRAAVWAVARTTNFRSAVLLAANLGEDADTTAAIAGQLAGAVYGLSGIPAPWLERLAWKDRIAGMADGLFDASLEDAPLRMRAAATSSPSR
jgi:ADP-ribosyl-[dinitrogen reductase] hydrolase